MTDTYASNGYTILRGLFSADEITAMQTECDRLLALELVDPQNGRTPYRFGASECPERIDPVVDISPLFADLVKDRRLIDRVAELLGEEPLLFKDKLILKAPGVDGYQMHQDWAWGWQDLCPADTILSVSIQIDGASSDNGGIELFSGYHHELMTPKGMKTNFRDEELAKVDLSRGNQVDTQAGDVLIFHSLTPHRSGRNTSSRWRRSLYLSMNAASVGDQRSAYYADYRADPAHHNGTYFR